jgi:hypothetical protein
VNLLRHDERRSWIFFAYDNEDRAMNLFQSSSGIDTRDGIRAPSVASYWRGADGYTNLGNLGRITFVKGTA